MAIDVNTGRHKGRRTWNDDPPDQSRSGRGNLPAAPPAQHRRPDRDRLHRHAPPHDQQQVTQNARRRQPRQSQDPHPAHLAARAHGNDAPASQRKHGQRGLRGLPVLQRQGHGEERVDHVGGNPAQAPEILRKLRERRHDIRAPHLGPSRGAQSAPHRGRNHAHRAGEKLFGKLCFRADPAFISSSSKSSTSRAARNWRREAPDGQECFEGRTTAMTVRVFVVFCGPPWRAQAARRR